MDVSFRGQLLDLEAVVQALGLQSFAILAQSHAGPLAIQFARDNPEVVSGLILFHSYARGATTSLPARCRRWSRCATRIGCSTQ